MDIIDVEDPDGVVVTLGGQTPLKLARALEEAGVRILGTSPEAIDLAEDRDRFSAILDEMNITYPAAGMASTFEEACQVADQIGFPLLVRPSYVLGGRGMAIVYDGAQLEKYMGEAAKISPDHPVYLDRFLEGAVEVDLDALCDGEQVYVGGVLEHIEMAGIHSGDSACCTPPFALSEAVQARLPLHRALARASPGRRRLDQHTVRHQGHGHLRHRGESAREPHGPVRLEILGRAAGQDRGPHHGGREALRPRFAGGRPSPGLLQRQRGGHAFRSFRAPTSCSVPR